MATDQPPWLPAIEPAVVKAVLDGRRQVPDRQVGPRKAHYVLCDSFLLCEDRKDITAWTDEAAATNAVGEPWPRCRLCQSRIDELLQTLGSSRMKLQAERGA